MKTAGDRLLAIARRWCSPRATERVLGPALADLRWEYRDALHRGRVWRARWIRATGSLTMVYLIARHAGLDRRRSLTPSPATASSLARVIARSVGLVVVVTAALLAIAMSNTPFPIAQRPWLLFYLLPATLPVVVPLGFGLAISQIPGARDSRLARRIGLVAAALSLLTFVNNGWIVPISNQAYRVGAAGRNVAKGFNELTFAQTRSELARERYLLSTPHASAAAIDIREGEYSYHGRLAISVAPLAAGLFAFGLSDRRRTLRAIGIMSMLVLYFTWYAGMRSPVQTFATLSPALVAWLPNLALVVAGAFGLRPSTSARRAA